MKLQGVFGVPAINKETGKEYIQPIPNVIVVLRTDKGVEYTFEVDSFGAYTTDIPIGEYGVQAYVKGNKQTLGYLRQGVHFPVTEATTVGDFDTWLKIDTVNNPDPLLSQWTQLLKDIEKQRTEFANDIKDVVAVIERESEPVIQNAIDRVQKEADAVRVEVETIVTNTQENLDAYLVTKKTQYDKDLAANVATSNVHLSEVTVIKTDIENLQKVFNTSKDKAIADLSSEYAKHSKVLTTETTTHKHTLTDHTGVLKTELTAHSDILKQSAVEEVGASIAVNTDISKTIQRYLEEGQALNTTITQSGETAVSNIKAQETSSLKSITNKESNTLSNIVSTTDSSIVSIRDAESLAINNFKSEALLESDTLLVKYKGDLQGEGDRVLGTISPTIEAELQEATLSLSQTLITSKAELGSKKDEHLVTIKTAEEDAIETIQSYVESSEYASIAYVDEQISSIPKVDLSGYLTKPVAESTYAKKTDLSKKADKSDITGLQSSIDKKVDTTVFNEEVVKKLEQKDLAGYSTENYVDQKFNSIDISKYATNTELATKWDKQTTSGTGDIIRESLLTDVKKDLTSAQISVGEVSAAIESVDNKVSAVATAAESAYNLANSKWSPQPTTGTGNIARMSEVQKAMEGTTLTRKEVTYGGRGTWKNTTGRVKFITFRVQNVKVSSEGSWEVFNLAIESEDGTTRLQEHTSSSGDSFVTLTFDLIVFPNQSIRITKWDPNYVKEYPSIEYY